MRSAKMPSATITPPGSSATVLCPRTEDVEMS